jgi:hypothetical protein
MNASSKFVYLFGSSRTEGSADMKNLLGRQRCQPGRDVSAGHYGAVGLHHQHRGLHRVHPAVVATRYWR